MMTQRRPAAPLAPFVRSLWHSFGRAWPTPTEAMLPTGATDVVINLSHDTMLMLDGDGRPAFHLPGAVIYGPRAEALVRDCRRVSRVVGISLRPEGAGAFFGIPAGELRGARMGLEDLWGPGPTRRLTGRLRETSSGAEALDVLERALLGRAARRVPDPLAWAVAQLDAAEPPSIGDLGAELRVSPRRLIALFTEHVGLTPKAFGRVRRFQAALRALRRGQGPWADLALGAGYSDQAHFIREFRAFTGVTPGAYAARRPAFANHLPLAIEEEG